MTFEKILNDLSSGVITPKDAKDLISEKQKMKRIQYYAHIWSIKNDPLKDSELQELESIVNILQVLYNSNVGSPIPDQTFDDLQEIVINMGIPRLTGSIELNDSSKVNHKYTALRGTLDKVYYLTKDEERKNPSREYLDDYLKRVEALYEKRTGTHLDFNLVKIMCQGKMDGISAIAEIDEFGKVMWLTRGDTGRNLASDISIHMNIFDSKFNSTKDCGVKTEIMVSEEDLAAINQLMPKDTQYKNSRQVVISTINQEVPDFKTEYLNPIPLREIFPNEQVEHIHPLLPKEYPTLCCTFGDRELIRKFANEHRYVVYKGKRYRTDGVVMTILDEEICKVLGRENNINKFEIAYKFTEEEAISKVKDVEFYVSDFGYITPVLVVNDIIMKGNTVNHISLSNKERFDELDLSYGDEVKVSYDIIPYAVVDKDCRRVKFGRKIEFTKVCPKCKQPLDLDVVQVQCKNPDCPSRKVGLVLNYCNALRIKNIGFNTLDTLYSVGLLDEGILSLYKLKRKQEKIFSLDGFGTLKTRKIIGEIEGKRKLKDYEFFGAIGIEGLHIKTFQQIFFDIKLKDFMEMLELRNYGLMKAKLTSVNGVGNAKADAIIEYLKRKDNTKKIQKLLKEVSLLETFGSGNSMNGSVIFSGLRPKEDVRARLYNLGYEAIDNFKKDAVAVVIPYEGFTSEKVRRAKQYNIPLITQTALLDDITILTKIRK